MDSDADAVARHHSGTAILALILGAAAVFTPTPLSTPVALFALLVAWKARSELRGDPQLRGTIASLAGFILAAGERLAAVRPARPSTQLLKRNSTTFGSRAISTVSGSRNPSC